MTFASVLLFCSVGIAVCACVVFLVETVVAFCLNERETYVQPKAALLSREQEDRAFAQDLAA